MLQYIAECSLPIPTLQIAHQIQHTAIRSCNVLHVTSKSYIVLNMYSQTCVLIQSVLKHFRIMNSCNRVNLIKAAIIKWIAISVSFSKLSEHCLGHWRIDKWKLEFRSFFKLWLANEELLDYSHFQNYSYSGACMMILRVSVCVWGGGDDTLRYHMNPTNKLGVWGDAQISIQ